MLRLKCETLARLPNDLMLNVWLNMKKKKTKQLLHEENKKSGNVMQKPMDSYVCGINTSSESILNRSYLLFARQTPEHVPVEFWYTYFTRKVNRQNERTF